MKKFSSPLKQFMTGIQKRIKACKESRGSDVGSEDRRRSGKDIRKSDEDKIIIQKWTRTVVKHGPEELKKDPSIWADHALHEKWRGYRASSFSYKGRIIYKVEDQIITVTVVRITEEHDCRKKE